MRRFGQLLLVSLGFAACKPAAVAKPAPTTPASSLGPHDTIAVGAPVPSGDAISLAAVLTTPDAYAGKTVLVEGKVKAACSRKGCWMELAPEGAGAPTCRIRFKDYGFFVPTNSAGATARLSGEVQVRTLPPEEVAHLTGEGATLARGADGSARAVEITATGVELMRL
ncbi:MAG: DUF4920 domain-containing protein [Polyangia bacterium]